MWEYALQVELMKKENRTALRYDYEYHNKKLEEWTEKHPEERHKQVYEAVKRYQERKKDDPEFWEKARAASAKSMRKSYAKKRAEMTPEELEEYRRKTRERVRAIRAKKKAEAEAAKKQGD